MAMAVNVPITGLRVSFSPAAPSSDRGVIMVKAQTFRPLFFGDGVGTPKYTGLRLSLSNVPRCYSYGGGALGTQMNIFGRFARVFKSYANALLSFFEDPERILEQSVIEMNADLVRMRQATAQVLASQKQLENKYKAAQKASEDWYHRAQLALGKGDEDLAREALKRRKSFADNANALKTQLDQQKVIVDNLVANTRMCSSTDLLESKIQEAKSKKDTLKARAQSAKTATKVSEMLGNVNTSSALSAFEKMEEKVLTMESKAEALNQLTIDDLEGKFAMLERHSVDDDLASLKKQLSGNTQELKGERPPRRTPVTSLKFQDSEIETEELKGERPPGRTPVTSFKFQDPKIETEELKGERPPGRTPFTSSKFQDPEIETEELKGERPRRRKSVTSFKFLDPEFETELTELTQKATEWLHSVKFQDPEFETELNELWQKFKDFT